MLGHLSASGKLLYISVILHKEAPVAGAPRLNTKIDMVRQHVRNLISGCRAHPNDVQSIRNTIEIARAAWDIHPRTPHLVCDSFSQPDSTLHRILLQERRLDLVRVWLFMRSVFLIDSHFSDFSCHWIHTCVIATHVVLHVGVS